MASPTIPSDISADAADLLKRSFEIDHDARPTAAQLLYHSFIAPPPRAPGESLISAGQARAAMAAATATREKTMQSLGALVG
jgi:mitogen-activated protein kinase kinase kinase